MATPPPVAANWDCLAHTPIRWRDYVPQRPLFTDEQSEVDFYCHTAFTAWEHALFRQKHHPKLWQAVIGSPYERLYRTRFHPEGPA